MLLLVILPIIWSVMPLYATLIARLGVLPRGLLIARLSVLPRGSLLAKLGVGAEAVTVSDGVAKEEVSCWHQGKHHVAG